MKRPAFQFYPADWAGNSNLKRCTHEEKGIWIDVMCILHDQDEYGVARWTAKELALAVGCTVSKLKSLINKGILKGADPNQKCDALIYTPRSGRKNGPPVTLIEEQPGPIWYSSRMVIDEYKRQVRGGDIAAPNAASNPTPDPSPKGGLGEYIGDAPNPTPDPSPFSRARGRPSTSSSSSTNKEKTNKKESSGTGDPADAERVCSPPGVKPPETEKPEPPGRPRDIPDAEPSPVSPHGAIAAFVRSQGMQASASDQELRDLVAKGATMAHFVEAVPVARQKGRGWKYLLGIVRNLLQDERAGSRAPPGTTLKPRRFDAQKAWDDLEQRIKDGNAIAAMEGRTDNDDFGAVVVHEPPHGKNGDQDAF